MKIYWSIYSIPELKGLEKEVAQEKYKTYFFRAFLHWGQWLGLSVLGLCTFTWSWMTKYLLPNLTGIATPILLRLVLLVVFSVLVACVISNST
jgi:hypothetical protein